MLQKANESDCSCQNTRRFKESEEMLLSAIAILEHLQNKEEKR